MFTLTDEQLTGGAYPDLGDHFESDIPESESDIVDELIRVLMLVRGSDLEKNRVQELVQGAIAQAHDLGVLRVMNMVSITDENDRLTILSTLPTHPDKVIFKSKLTEL